MKKHIVEDLPARKFPQASLSVKKDDAGGERKEKSSGQQSPEERVSQAASDIRYKARTEKMPLRQAYDKYMQNSSLSEQEKSMVRKKIFGEGGGNVAETVMNDIQVSDMVAENVANAMFRVFVDNNIETETIFAENTYLEELSNSSERKYKIRVTDKATKTSYVRYATREKINQLRANPNIESVEMTEYGEPREGERKGGKETAKAKAGKGLDPVGKEDKDIDNDGDHDKTDKYLLNRREVRSAAIAKKKVTEEFVGEFNPNQENPDANTQMIDVMSRRKKNTIVVNPPESKDKLFAHYEISGAVLSEKAVSKSQQKFMGMVLAAKRGAEGMSPEVEKAAAGMSEKEARKFAKTKHKGLPKHKKSKKNVKEESECQSNQGENRDKRGDYAKTNVLKNKIRSSTGIKNPIVMVAHNEMEGEKIDEVAGALLKLAGAGLGMWAASKGMEAAKKKVDDSINTKRRNSRIGGERYGNLSR